MPEILMVNPRKRKAKKRKTKRKTRAKGRRLVTVSKRTSVVKKRRKNPARRQKGIAGMVSQTLVPGATAAGGALALDVAWGMLPIPENLKTGPIRHVAKAAGAIGIGMLANMFTKSSTANLIATGAMTVVMHNAGREMLGKVAPNLTLGEYEDYDYDDMGYAGAGWGVGDDDDLATQMSEYMGAYEDDEGAIGVYQPEDISEMGVYEEDEIEL